MSEKPVRNAIMTALAVVSHYEDKRTGRPIGQSEAKCLPRYALHSVGIPYSEVLEYVKRHVPWSKADRDDLRWVAHMVRIGAPGFEGCVLPQKRPRTARKVDCALMS